MSNIFLDHSFPNWKRLLFLRSRIKRIQTGLTIGDMKLKSKRDELVETALRLFYTQGFNATGIDKINRVTILARKNLWKAFVIIINSLKIINLLGEYV